MSYGTRKFNAAFLYMSYRKFSFKHIYIYIYTHIHIYIHKYTYIYIHIYIYIYIYICIIINVKVSLMFVTLSRVWQHIQDKQLNECMEIQIYSRFYIYCKTVVFSMTQKTVNLPSPLQSIVRT